MIFQYPIFLILIFVPLTFSLCFEKVDVVAIIDESGSVGKDNFEIAKQFTISVASHLNLSKNGSRMSVIRFESFASNYITINSPPSKNLSLFENKIDAMQYCGTGVGCNTNTGDALRLARLEHLPYVSENHVLLILTDGNPTRPVNNPIQNAQNEYFNLIQIFPKTRTVAVGVGENINSLFLNSISTSTFTMSNYTTALENVRQITLNLLNCTDSPTQSPTAEPTVPTPLPSNILQTPSPSANPFFAPTSDCSSQKNIFFLVDSSRSISRKNFSYIKQFLRNISRNLNLGINETRIALTTYSQRVQTHVHLESPNSHNESLFRQAVSNLPKLNSWTNIGEALKQTEKTIQSNTTTGISNYVILLSDGEPNRPFQHGGPISYTKSNAELLKHQPYTSLISYGIGKNIDFDLLKNISDVAVEVENFQDLSTHVAELIDILSCSVPVFTTTYPTMTPVYPTAYPTKTPFTQPIIP